MDAETAKALEDSIAHWKRMRDDPECDETPSAGECPLCLLFKASCSPGCPVWLKAGAKYCDQTPYYTAVAEWDGHGDGWQDAAQAEIDFLESLRD